MAKRAKAVRVVKPRRPKGTGSVLKKPDGTYYGRVPVGKYPSGRTRYREVSGRTKTEVERDMKLLGPAGPDATVKEWAERWKAGLVNVAKSSVKNYKRAADRVADALGHHRLADVTLSQVKAALAGWVVPGSRGAATANYTLTIARIMSDAAVQEGLLTRDPFALCPMLKTEETELDPFTRDELKRIIAAWPQDELVGGWFALCAATGMRVGEISALDVEDIDTTRWVVSITKTYDQRYGVGPPKSRHGRREISIPPQARASITRAISGRTTGILFRAVRGGRFNGSRLFKLFKKCCEKLGVRHRKIHCLRHGVLTELVARGVPLGDVAKHAGHSVATLIRTYLHPVGHDVGSELAQMWE